MLGPAFPRTVEVYLYNWASVTEAPTPVLFCFWYCAFVFTLCYPQTGFTLQNKQQQCKYSSTECKATSVKLLQYNAVRTPAIQQPKESTSALSLNKSTDHIPVSCWKESQRQVVTQKEMDFALSKGQAYYSDGSTLSHHCVALLFLALLFLSFFFKPSMLALSKFEYAWKNN